METRTTCHKNPLAELVASGHLTKGQPITLMGVDCGYGAPGLAIVKTWAEDGAPLIFEFGECIETERAADRQSVAYDDCGRISTISEWLRKNYDKWKPHIVSMEIPMSGARGAMAIKGMAFAMAVSIATADSYFNDSLVLQLCTPYETKRFCTGKSKADKDEMIKAVEMWFKSPPVWPRMVRKNGIDSKKSEAIADSIAAVLTFLQVKLPSQTPLSCSI